MRYPTWLRFLAGLFTFYDRDPNEPGGNPVAVWRSEVEYIDAELRAIHEAANRSGEERSLTPDEQSRWDAGVEHRNIRIAQGIDFEARAAVLRSAEYPALTETGDGTRDAGFQHKRDADPFDGLEAVRTMPEGQKAVELRGRSLKAIERGDYTEDAHRESATRIAQSDARGDLNQWMLDHGSPEYVEAFREAMAHPIRPNLSRFSERAALSLTGANGGYLMPTHLDPTIILTNNGATNPFREIASVKQTVTDAWNGVTSAGVTAEWIAEATQVADASPTFGQAPIDVHKADAYVQASLEVISDTAVSGELSMLISDAKDRLEAAAFATGSGSGQPFGIVTDLGLVTASRVAGSSGAAGAADFVVADVYAVAAALPPRYRPNSSWVAEYGTQLDIRQFGTSNVHHAFWTDLGPATPSQLLGRPIYESSAMDTTIVSGSNDDVLILGDFRHGYYIVDRMGVELAYEPLVKGANQRPTGEVGWVAFWRVGGKAVDPNAFRMLRL